MDGRTTSRGRKQKQVLVLGGGVAGATAADRLGRSGLQVDVVERKPWIGGHVVEMGCKATSACLRCNVCVANDALKRVLTAPNVRIHTQTELVDLAPPRNGSRYTAVLEHKPTFIDVNRCISCGVCFKVCPEKCIRMAYPAMSLNVPVIDFSSCRLAAGRKCSKCADACPVDAINLTAKGSSSRLDVDAVVLATGYDAYDPAEDASYGYGRVANVITGQEAERQLGLTGTITRPSDGERPKRLAFIQCVGSRSEEAHRRPEDTDYCSAVCCSYALRIARLMKYQASESDITIFYMDIQNFGKGFSEFYRRCRGEMRFVRCRPYEISQGPDSSVRVRYVSDSSGSEGGSPVSEKDFDLVVLAVGIRPTSDAGELSDKLMVSADDEGFFGFKGVVGMADLRRAGMFAVGACESPKDIASSIAQAEAVSAAILGEVR